MQLGRRSCHATSIAVGVCLSVLLSACGAAHPSAASRSRASATTSAPTSSTATTPATSGTSGETAAVLAAYRAGWKAFEQALATANPADPALAATMVDPQLQSVKANLLSDQVHGMVGRGTTTLHPKVVSISATTATVVDCAYSTAELVYARTGKPVPPVTPPENDGVRSTLVLVNGAWKVAKQTVTDGKCAPGS